MFKVLLKKQVERENEKNIFEEVKVFEEYLKTKDLKLFLNYLKNKKGLDFDLKDKFNAFISNKENIFFEDYIVLSDSTVFVISIDRIVPIKNLLCNNVCTENIGSFFPIEIIFPEVYKKMEEIVEESMEEVDDPCCDNFRIALKNDTVAVKEYKKAKESGCCGSFDKEYEINGETFLIGFNYGH